ncbi:hypothetical protein ABZT04_20180 [Streptomyces sp. NPDC005492]|uniref:hypothetical protein n=1 Tax=Streptomyces sp. NPDC005492 TaxID=3156883 RepID=UPI0033ACB266
MKVRTPPPRRDPVTITRPDGSTFETTRTVEFAPEAVPPRDWDVISTRAAVGMVLALTAVAVAWSTWSIGSLLHGGVGFLAATVFDLSWGTALILEWKARFDPDKRFFPQSLGWGLLAVTMGAIFWNAWPDVRYGVVGAVVSGVAKILWLGIMKHIEVTLTQRDRDDLRDRTSRANVRVAFASVDRAVMRTEAHTTAVRRSLAGGRPTVLELSASDRDTDPAELASAGRQFAEQLTEPSPAQAQAHGPAQAQLSEPTAQVEELVRRLTNGEQLTKSTAAGILGVSEATAGRRLRDARNQAGGGYL